ncbi:MAG TPA: ComEA family DNA-binding protein [Pyrinomonadaceae bacterium]|nr:ComEA family DNA-binding protein [Pyrinomonadaceae bacterium]
MKSAFCPAFWRPVFFCSALVLLAATSCVRLPRQPAAAGAVETLGGEPNAARAATTPPVNINRAAREELERLPGIGPALAQRIVEHRERHGAFRRVEHLLVVRGISERRFAELRAHVTAE